MAAKFKIFCDDCPPRFEPEDKTSNQQQSQQHQQQQQLQQQQLYNSLKSAPNNPNHEQYNNRIKLDDDSEQDKLIALHPAQSVQTLISGPPPKREPLGLRQDLGQSAPTFESSNAPSLTSTSSSSALSVDDEDQENDISMASLGSDFVPSILHTSEDYDDEQNFEVYEEHDMNSSGGVLVELSCTEEYDDDLDNDEELKAELAEAFRQHDESQLFKSAIYLDDIKAYLRDLERDPDLRPLPNYMDYQPELDSDKRAILINWLVEVSDEYDLQTETLFICTGIMDRFLSKMSISTNNYQLLGVAAMYIASKYEEIYPPSLYQFVELTDNSFTQSQIRQMEQEILKTLDFRISTPTILFFLRQIFAFNKFSKKVYYLAEYLCYLALLADKPFLDYYPSEIALAAVIVATDQLDTEANISTDLKIAYEQSLRDQTIRKITPCRVSLKDIQQHAPRDSCIVQRYSSESFSCVALVE